MYIVDRAALYHDVRHTILFIILQFVVFILLRLYFLLEIGHPQSSFETLTSFDSGLSPNSESVFSEATHLGFLGLVIEEVLVLGARQLTNNLTELLLICQDHVSDGLQVVAVYLLDRNLSTALYLIDAKQHPDGSECRLLLSDAGALPLEADVVSQFVVLASLSLERDAALEHL